MEFKETYLQRAWSDSIESVTMDDVKLAIVEIQKQDAEHGTFWVGIVDDDEFILEVQKDLSLMGILDRESQEEFHSKAKDWKEVEGLFELFLGEKFEEVKKRMR